MIIKCLKSELCETLSIVSKAVSSKSTLPVLEGIFLKADEDSTLTLIGNDLEISVESKINVEVIKPGKAVLNAKMFMAIAKSMPSENLTIEVKENNGAVIKSGNSKFEIMGIDPMEFPEIAYVASDYEMEMPNNTLKNMISKTSFSVSQSDQRPVLKGCLLEIKGNKVKMVAVDKFRMAIREEELEESFEERQIIIPEKALSEVSKILKDDEKVKISCNSKNVVFTFDNYKFTSRLIEGEFIKYESAISKTFETEIECSKTELCDTINRASLMMVNEALKSPIKFNIGDNNINVSCETMQGSFEDDISVPTGYKNLLIGFNNTFLLDALRACDDEMIKMSMNENVNPLVITPIEGDKFLYLVLPMKI